MSVREIVSSVVGQFREELTNLVESSVEEPMTRDRFAEMVAAGAIAKFWLEPVSLASSSRLQGHELRRLERLVAEHPDELLESWRHGMTSSSPSVDPRAVDVATDDDNLTVDLADGDG